jgi:hypothetical protein
VAARRPPLPRRRRRTHRRARVSAPTFVKQCAQWLSRCAEARLR